MRGLGKIVNYMLSGQVIKFGIVGVSNTLVDTIVYWTAIEFMGINYQIAQILGYSFGIANSFLLNKIWTFKDSGKNKKTTEQLVKFVIINIVSLSLTLLALTLLVDTLGLDKLIAKLIVIVIAQIVNFLGYKLWVFRDSEKISIERND
ncbi:UNVERIFIED_CONTAM: putative flippase GtrA [Acetivibrio alkalicellulosi]